MKRRDQWNMCKIKLTENSIWKNTQQPNFEVSLTVKLIRMEFLIKLLLKELEWIMKQRLSMHLQKTVLVGEGLSVNTINKNGEWVYFYWVCFFRLWRPCFKV